MNDGPGGSARFPFIIPIRCPFDGASLEMRTPDEVRCTECGSTQKRLTNRLAKVAQMLEPDADTVSKAAQRLHTLLPAYSGHRYEELKHHEKLKLKEAVKEVVKTLKQG